MARGGPVLPMVVEAFASKQKTRRLAAATRPLALKVTVTTPFTAPVVVFRQSSTLSFPEALALDRVMKVHVPQLLPAPAMLLTVGVPEPEPIPTTAMQSPAVLLVTAVPAPEVPASPLCSVADDPEPYSQYPPNGDPLWSPGTIGGGTSFTRHGSVARAPRGAA